MYDDLHEALVGCYTAVRWFAIGEAVRLATTIEKICVHYPEKKEDENFRQALVEIAERTAGFLKRQNTKDSKAAVEKLQKVLTRMQMEM